MIKITLIAVTLTLFTPRAIALSCWETSVHFLENPLAAALDIADAVFVGEVTYTLKTTSQSKGEEEILIKSNAAFSVEETLKGKASGEVTVYGGNPTECSCNYDFEVGVKYLVIGRDRETGYSAAFCDFIRPRDENYYKHVIEQLSLPKRISARH